VRYQSAVFEDELLAVVRGTFDGSLAPLVHADLAAAFEIGVKRVVIDLCDATLVDEGAMAVLAAAAVVAINNGGQLYLAMETDRVVEIADASLVRAVFEP
jgi:anti-anti-sigma regulatory factor